MARGLNICNLPSPYPLPCFAQNPTQALSSSDLQLLLGLPLSGSSGGYAHQTTLRLFSLLYKRSSNQDLSGCLSSNGLEFESSEVLKGLSQAWGCGLGVGHPGHGTEGRGRRRRQCSVAARSAGRYEVPGEAEGGRRASTTLPPAWDAPPGQPTTLTPFQAKTLWKISSLIRSKATKFLRSSGNSCFWESKEQLLAVADLFL